MVALLGRIERDLAEKPALEYFDLEYFGLEYFGLENSALENFVLGYFVPGYSVPGYSVLGSFVPEYEGLEYESLEIAALQNLDPVLHPVLHYAPRPVDVAQLPGAMPVFERAVLAVVGESEGFGVAAVGQIVAQNFDEEFGAQLVQEFAGQTRPKWVGSSDVAGANQLAAEGPCLDWIGVGVGVAARRARQSLALDDIYFAVPSSLNFQRRGGGSMFFAGQYALVAPAAQLCVWETAGRQQLYCSAALPAYLHELYSCRPA